MRRGRRASKEGRIRYTAQRHCKCFIGHHRCNQERSEAYLHGGRYVAGNVALFVTRGRSGCPVIANGVNER